MNRREFTTVFGAALAGIAMGAKSFASQTAPTKDGDAKKAETKEKEEKHVCRGLNSCKAKGSCKTKDHECAGKNECKGKGGCATASVHHSCSGKNECKGLGGCGSGDNGCGGKNSCKGKGGCAVPVHETMKKDEKKPAEKAK